MSRATLDKLRDTNVVALRCKGDQWPRTFMAATLIPDGWMGLLLRPDGRRWFVPSGEDPRPERDDTLVLVRNRAITVPVDVVGAPSADDHPVEVQAEALVRCLAKDDDMAAFARAMLPEETLSLDRLAAALEVQGAPAAVRAFVRARSAAELVEGDHRDALLAHLRDALQAFLFSSGLTAERIGRLAFRSRSLEAHVQLERDAALREKAVEARGRIEQAALAATRRRLDHLGDVLDKLRATAAAEPSRWKDLLPGLTPGERGRLLESLWRLMPDRATTTAIVVVAGRECVWLDPDDPGRITRRLTLPDDLGGLRSVTFAPDAEALLVGASVGVWHLHAADGRVLGAFRVPTTHAPRTGFNAALATKERLLATHSQLGAWSWSLHDAEDARPFLSPADGVPRTIRAVTRADDGTILLAADDTIRAFSASGEPLWQSAAADGAIHCVAPLGDSMYAGTARGALLRSSLDGRGAWELVRRVAGEIESIAARRWDDLTELVIPAGADGVCSIYAEEGIVARLLDAKTPIRRAWASDDTLVGLNEHRDRLLVLNGNMPARCGREVPLARMLGRSIQDACLLTRRESADERPGENAAGGDE